MGCLASLYGIVWAKCICGIALMVGLVVISFASVIARLFPFFMCAVFLEGDFVWERSDDVEY